MGTMDISTFTGPEWEEKSGIWSTVGYPDAYAFPKKISCSVETFYLFYEDLRKVDLDEDREGTPDNFSRSAILFLKVRPRI